MSTTCRRVLALVGLFVRFASLGAMGSREPVFSCGMGAGWSERGEEVVR
jgi:hypothetical protein